MHTPGAQSRQRLSSLKWAINQNIMVRKIDILIADDHEIFRQGLCQLLASEHDFAVVGEAGTGEEAVQLTRRKNPEIVLMDVMMPVMNGVEATRKIKAEYPEVGIIGFSMSIDKKIIRQMMNAGARGYLVKSAPPSEVLQGIRAVHRGELFLSRKIEQYRTNIMEELQVHAALENLKLSFSKKEIKVLRLICEEYSAKEIAEKMHLSKKTIDWYRDRLISKTGSKSTAGLIVFALKNNLLEY